MKGPQARRYTQKAVHTQGGTHKRRSVATAGVMLFKGGAGAGPRVERSEPKVGGGWVGGGDFVHTIDFVPRLALGTPKIAGVT